MMNLFCPQCNVYLELADGKFSIEAKNQKQDLEGYTVAQTYDLKLVNNTVNAALVKGLPFDYNGKRIVDYQILLMVNNAPFLTGRLIYQSSDPDTITAVYQALPYGPAFKNFIFRKKLRDYFAGEQYFMSFQMSHLMERGGGTDSMRGKNVDTTGWDPNDPSTIDNIKVHSIIIKPLNNTNNDFTNTVQSAMDNVNNYNSMLSASELLYPMLNNSEQFERWFAKSNLMDLLHCLGIYLESPKDYLKEFDVIYPMAYKFERLFKVRYYMSKAESSGFAFLGNPTFIVSYYASRTSPIWSWDDIDQVWVSEEEGWDPTSPFSTTLTPNGCFADTLRSNKAVKDMEVVGVDQEYIHMLNSIQLTSSRLQQNMLFNMSEGQTFDEMQGCAPAVIIRDLADVNLLPEYVDVVYRIKVDKNIQNYPKKGKITDPTYATIPTRPHDIPFFDMETGDFLNWLSLNVRSFVWLRNPMFLCPENAEEVWNQDGSRVADFIDDSNIISITRKLDPDAPSNLRITVPMAQKASVTRHLNDLGNDDKVVSMEMASLAYSQSIDPWDEDATPCPPCFFDSKKEHGEKVQFGDMQALVGTWEKRKMATKKGKQYDVYMWLHDNADFDYLDEYEDHSVVYTVKCTGYQMHEYVYINKTKYAVLSYKTDDMTVWTLELLRVNPDY